MGGRGLGLESDFLDFLGDGEDELELESELDPDEESESELEFEPELELEMELLERFFLLTLPSESER